MVSSIIRGSLFDCTCTCCTQECRDKRKKSSSLFEMTPLLLDDDDTMDENSAKSSNSSIAFDGWGRTRGVISDNEVVEEGGSGAGGWGRERTSNTAWGYGGRCRVRPVMAEEEGGGRGG